MQHTDNVIVQPIDFILGSIVYLLTDTDNLPRMVTGVTIRTGGNLLYELSQGTQVSYHIAAEISETKGVF